MASVSAPTPVDGSPCLYLEGWIRLSADYWTSLDLTWTEPTSIRQERLKPEVPEAASAAWHFRLSLNYGQDFPEGLLATLFRSPDSPLSLAS